MKEKIEEMNGAIYLRPLKEEDARKSVVWRNDPHIWRYTGSKPDKFVTFEMELDWFRSVITRCDEKRFAVCTKDEDEYIGNVQFTAITSRDAEFHLFIGERSFWNRGFGTQATRLMLHYGFTILNLSCVYLFVSVENEAAIKTYLKSGFKVNRDYTGQKTRMDCMR